MTIPAGDTWCTECQETCHDHPSICTVCGTTLAPHPPPAATPRSSTSLGGGVRAVPEFLNDDLRQATDDLRQASQELRIILSNLRGQVHDIDVMAREAILGSNNNNNTNEWQTIPPELLQPQAADGSRGRPTSKEILRMIPRISLNEQSSLFRQATFAVRVVDSTKAELEFSTIPGEFGPNILLERSTVVLASPRTGKGGLSQETKLHLQNSSITPIIYMERGDGLTFVQKAVLAQEAGAKAVVIGNNMPNPWPYIMKDSKREAEKLGLKIPVAMIKQADGKKLVEYCSQEHGSSSTVTGTFKIEPLSKDCVVCCEDFEPSQTVLQLPACGHVFHEACALIWLTKHNTCPYCRRELPTDDPEYEAERRRVQRTHAGSTAANSSGSSEWNDFYG